MKTFFVKRYDESDVILEKIEAEAVVVYGNFAVFYKAKIRDAENVVAVIDLSQFYFVIDKK